MTHDENCPICHQDAKRHDTTIIDAFSVDCPVCGKYLATGTVWHLLRNTDRYDTIRPYLSAHIRQETEATATRVRIDSGNIEDLAQRHMHTSVQRKMAMLLELLATRTKHPGAGTPFNYLVDWPLLDAASHLEALFFLRYLLNTRLVDGDVNATMFLITVAGWQHILPPDAGGVPGTCFVAMSFAKELDEAFDSGFMRSIEEDCGFKVIRVDRVEHNDDITDKILAGIRTAQFIVADATLQRQGVYYEAGFGAGLGRIVIWCCRADDFEHVHFDTRQLNHVVWDNPADLREKLTARIRGTVALSAQLKA